MAHDPQAEFNTPVSFRDANGSNPVDIIVGNGVPDGAADPQASALIGTFYCNYGASDDTSPWYVKVDEDSADDDWVALPLSMVSTAFDINGHWEWQTDKRIRFRDTTLSIYSPSASTLAVDLAASGDTFQIGNQTNTDYAQFDEKGTLTLTGDARIEPMGAIQVYDDFFYGTSFSEVTTPWILNSGTDDLAVDPDCSSQQEGGVIIVTTGDDDGTVGVDGSQIVGRVPMQADSGGLVMEARLHLNAITNVSVNIGFTDNTALEEPFSNAADVITCHADDAACFVFDTDATTDEWWMCCVDSTAADAGNATTGTAPVAGTYQVFRIEISDDGNSVAFYIDGTLEGTLTNAGISPDVNLYPTVIACGDGTASKTVDVDYIFAGVTR